MDALLREVLAAHGGIDRWKRYGKVSATIVSGGDLFDAKGLKSDMTPRKVSTATKVERMIATPFGNPNSSPRLSGRYCGEFSGCSICL
jgi:hypothetical protein